MILGKKATDLKNCIGACARKDCWTALSVAVDSGACDNVIAPDAVEGYEEKITETKESLGERSSYRQQVNRYPSMANLGYQF